MSVSITKIVEANRSFEASQLKAFQQFIDVSKELKGAVTTEQTEAKAMYSAMLLLVDSLQQPVPANGMAPIAVLESDEDYMQALADVTLLPDNLYQPGIASPYMDAFIRQVSLFMKQRELNNE